LIGKADRRARIGHSDLRIPKMLLRTLDSALKDILFRGTVSSIS